MKTRREREAERERMRANQEREVWDDLVGKLAKVKDLKDALMLAHSGPGPDRPGRRYYSNFQFFMGGFAVPGGANGTERSMYLQIVRRLDANGELKPGALAEVEERFKEAAEPQFR
jgi:hypothetical protein